MKFYVVALQKEGFIFPAPPPDDHGVVVFNTYRAMTTDFPNNLARRSQEAHEEQNGSHGGDSRHTNTEKHRFPEQRTVLSIAKKHPRPTTNSTAIIAPVLNEYIYCVHLKGF